MAPKAKTGNSGKSVAPAQLTPWKPGQSGNPAGRPKDRLRPALRAQLSDDDIREINRLAIADAKSPDPEVRARARAWLVEQVDGKLVDKRESGTVGAFDSQVIETLDALPSDQLRKVVKALKPAV